MEILYRCGNGILTHLPIAAAEDQEDSPQQNVMRLREAVIRSDQQLVLLLPLRLAASSGFGLELRPGTGPGLLSGLLDGLADRAGLFGQLFETIQRHRVGYLLELVRSHGWLEERVLEVSVLAEGAAVGRINRTLVISEYSTVDDGCYRRPDGLLNIRQLLQHCEGKESPTSKAVTLLCTLQSLMFLCRRGQSIDEKLEIDHYKSCFVQLDLLTGRITTLMVNTTCYRVLAARSQESPFCNGGMEVIGQRPVPTSRLASHVDNGLSTAQPAQMQIRPAQQRNLAPHQTPASFRLKDSTRRAASHRPAAHNNSIR